MSQDLQPLNFEPTLLQHRRRRSADDVEQLDLGFGENVSQLNSPLYLEQIRMVSLEETLPDTSPAVTRSKVTGKDLGSSLGKQKKKKSKASKKKGNKSSNSSQRFLKSGTLEGLGTLSLKTKCGLTVLKKSWIYLLFWSLWLF